MLSAGPRTHARTANQRGRDAGVRDVVECPLAVHDLVRHAGANRQDRAATN